MKTVEAKKTVSQTRAETPSLNAAQVVEFLGDVKSELQKISWTSPEELIVYTKIVVGATFVLGLGVYILDIAIHTLLSGLYFFLNLLG